MSFIHLPILCNRKHHIELLVFYETQVRELRWEQPLCSTVMPLCSTESTVEHCDTRAECSDSTLDHVTKQWSTVSSQLNNVTPQWSAVTAQSNTVTSQWSTVTPH